MNEENAKKESEMELIKNQLSNIYYKRAFDEDFNRGIRVIDSNKKSQFIWDNGNEIVMAYRSLWLRIECIEPLSGLAILLSTFKLNLVDDEMKEFNPFFSKSKAIEILKEGLFCVADKNGYFYKYDAEQGYWDGRGYIKELPDSEYISENILLMFEDLESEQNFQVC